MTASVQTRPKPLCISCHVEAKLFLRHRRISDMYRCGKCGLIFADPGDYLDEENYTPIEDVAQLSDDQRTEFSRVYSEGIDTSDSDGNMYSEFGLTQEDMSSGLFDLVAEAIGRYTTLRADSRFNMLDVGCATGFLLNEARKAYPNARLCGVEPSPVSCHKARKLYGLEIHQGTMNTFDPSATRFDVVSILGSLQLHEDPFKTLRQVFDVMNPGGVLTYHMKNPYSSARRIARAAAAVPVIKNARLTNLAIERSHLCMRYAASKSMLARKTEEIGFECQELRTIPPRVLAWSDRTHAHARGAGGTHLVRPGSHRPRPRPAPWIQVTCIKPADS